MTLLASELYEAAAKDVNISRVTLDLDRVVFHENFNLSKRDKLLSEHPQDVTQESWLRLEQWFVLRAKRPGVSARDLAREYGLEELRHYLDRSRVAIDQRRGWEFAEETVFPPSDVADFQRSVRKPGWASRDVLAFQGSMASRAEGRRLAYDRISFAQNAQPPDRSNASLAAGSTGPNSGKRFDQQKGTPLLQIRLDQPKIATSQDYAK